jgi:hypothetical protein
MSQPPVEQAPQPKATPKKEVVAEPKTDDIDIFMEVGDKGDKMWQITLDSSVYPSLSSFADWWKQQKDMTQYVRFYVKGKEGKDSKPFPGTKNVPVEPDSSSSEDDEEESDEENEKDQEPEQATDDPKDDEDETESEEDDDNGEGEDESESEAGEGEDEIESESEEEEEEEIELEPTNSIPIPDDYQAAIYVAGKNKLSLNTGEDEVVVHKGYEQFVI